MSVEQSTHALRVGVIGIGWAGETHLKSYLQLPDVQVLALAGLEEDRLASLGEMYNVPHLYPDYQEVIIRDDLDAVSVCAPNHLHAVIAIAALEQGKHVLCEKPLARSGSEAEEIVQAAVNAHRVLKVVFNHRARHDVQVLKRYLESGELGRIYHVKASWMRRNGIPGLGSWFTKKGMAGGGPLIDLGVHVLDLAFYLLDEPEVVTVSAATYAEFGPRGRGGRSFDNKMLVGDGYDVEDLATAFIRFVDGTTLLLEASWTVYRPTGDDFGVTLYGTEGGAAIQVENYSWEDTLRIYKDAGDTPVEIHPHLRKGEGHLAVVREFVNVIKDGNWSAHVGRDGLYRAQIIDACYASAREGREVAFDAITTGLGSRFDRSG